MPRDSSHELAYGFHPVREALRSRPHAVRSVLTSRQRGGKRRDEIEGLCRRHGVPFERVAETELTSQAGPAHNGFCARLVPALPAVAEVAADLVVLLEDVQDPRNLGAVLRVCEGAGVGRVLVRDRGSAPITPTVVKAAAGATEWLAVERIVSPARSLEALKQNGFWVYGAAAGGETPWSVDLTGRLVLCFGGEERGLRRRTRELCDGLVGLPMRGRLDSLNVATAAGALLYEAVRQRTLAATLPGAEERG